MSKTGSEFESVSEYYETIKEKEGEHKKIIYEVLCNLQEKLVKDDEIFLSEADFQFSFAQELDKILKDKEKESPKIILEYPFLTHELYCEENDYDKKYCDFLKDKICGNCRETDKSKCTSDCKESRFKGKNRSNIDLYFEYDDKVVYIEFKYKTKKLEDVQRGSSKNFTLKDHSNETDQRYAVYKDIERIEHCLKWHNNNDEKKSKKCFGYVIFMTNNKSHWNSESKVEKCRLCDGKTNIYQDDDKDYIWTTKEYNAKWTFFKQSTNKNKSNDNTIFNILVIDCNEIADCECQKVI